jgi:hypothetical protein
MATAKDETTGVTDEEAVATTEAAQQQPKVRFNTAELKSSYCNVCNATSTRDEVVLNFGLNETWDQGAANVDVKLLHRIILSPHAAERLHDLLSKLMAEHKTRYGKMN